MRVRCPRCDLVDRGSYRSLPGDFEPRDGDRINWTPDGCARCPDCGHQLDAEIGGWVKPLRWRCLGCGDPLNGRQVKWCSRKFGRWSKACSLAWDNPGLLAGELARRQQNLCGICIRPLSGSRPVRNYTIPERMMFRDDNMIEVDHVIPVSRDGPRVIANLRATHRRCNQAKKTRPLAEARIYLGLTDTEVLRRLAGAEPETVRLLRGPALDPLRANPMLLRPMRRLYDLDRDQMALAAPG